MEDNRTLTKGIALLFLRDLDRLKDELEQYPTEESLWTFEGDIKNTAGNLAIHLCGNLRHFVGHVIGNSNYQRQRDAEFSVKNVSLAEILETLEACRAELREAFEQFTDDRLSETFPINVMQRTWTNHEFLMHLVGHLNYHLGQINYHRRIITT